METKAKELVRNAKDSEKEDPFNSVKLYKDAALLYEQINDINSKNSSLERAAKILKKQAKLLDDPEEAFSIYNNAMNLYEEIENISAVEKIKSESNKKFYKIAKDLRNEAKKSDNLEEVEQKFSTAAKYFIQAEDEEESKKSWLECGKKLHQMASDQEEPLDALNLFNRAILNYRKAGANEDEDQAISDGASKFYHKGNEIIKSNKKLIMAYYYLNQALNLVMYLGDPDKQVTVEEKLSEVREMIGMSDDILFSYFTSQGLENVSIVQNNNKDLHGSINDKFKGKPESDDINQTNKIQVDLDPKMETEFSEKSDKTEDNLEDETFPMNHSSLMSNSSEEQILYNIINQKPNNSIRNRIKQEFQEGRKKTDYENSTSNDPEIDKLMDEILPETIDEIIDPEFTKSSKTSGYNSDHNIEQTKIEPSISNDDVFDDINIPIKKETKQPEPQTSRPQNLSPPTDLLDNKDYDSVDKIQNKLKEAKLKLSKPRIVSSQEEGVNTFDVKNEQTTQEEVVSSKLPESIVDILKTQGYLNRALGDENKFVDIAEYKTLSYIINNHPIGLEEIESKIEVASISMVLSNLSADGLIEQTNDYQYTITKSVESRL